MTAPTSSIGLRGKHSEDFSGWHGITCIPPRQENSFMDYIFTTLSRQEALFLEAEVLGICDTQCLLYHRNLDACPPSAPRDPTPLLLSQAGAQLNFGSGPAVESPFVLSLGLR